MLKAGKLDRRITIQVDTPAQDSYGQPVASWSNVATVWCQVIPFSGRERFISGQESAEAVTRFVIRWRSDVSETNRISYDGDIYDIESIRELGRREGLEIVARALVPA